MHQVELQLQETVFGFGYVFALRPKTPCHGCARGDKHGSCCGAHQHHESERYPDAHHMLRLSLLLKAQKKYVIQSSNGK